MQSSMNKIISPLILLLKRYGMWFAILIGLLTRLSLTLKVGFPYNDGGLFYAMIKDLQANHYFLPLFTSYNSQSIPYVYPPFAFYFTGLLVDLSHLPLIELIRWLPILFSLLTISIVYHLSLKLLGSELQAAVSALIFSILLPAYDELIMGGGLTRAMGEVFALLSFLCVLNLYQKHRLRHGILLALFAALALLSHPVKAWFACYSLALFFLFWGRSLKGFLTMVIAGVSVLALTAPWWVTVLMRHGLEPLLAAFGNRNNDFFLRPLVSLWLFNFTNAPWLDILSLLGLIGLIILLLKKKYFLPVWLLLIVVIEPKATLSLTAIPFSMIITIGLKYMLKGFSAFIIQEKITLKNRLGAPAFWVTGLILFYAWSSSYITINIPYLTADDLLAQQWVSQNTPSDAQFIVLSGQSWWQDPISEWFPVLAKRVSLATVQGFEWTSQQRFNDRINQYQELQNCVQLPNMDCLIRWQALSGEAIPYIFVSKNLKEAELTQLNKIILESNQYALIYDGPGALVYQK